MKTAALVLLALVCALPCGAQTAADDAAAAEAAITRERDRIGAERAAIQTQYATEERACYARFAVNDCLDKARSRRNAALSGLRRQELALNEEERRRKAEARERAQAERNAPERLEAERRRRKEAKVQRSEREAAAAEKAARRASDMAERAGKGRPADASAGGGLKTQQPQPGEAAANRQAFEERVKDAQERKARIQQRNAERAKPPASALPLPTP